MRAIEIVLAALVLVNFGTAEAAPKTLYAFTGASDGSHPMSPLLNANGVLYGVTSSGGSNGSGTVFAFDPAARHLTTLYNLPTSDVGTITFGPLAFAGGLLYGTSETTNGDDGGFIYSVNPLTSSGAIIYNFQGGQDGQYAATGVISVNNQLYGTTRYGGGAKSGCLGLGCGTIYQIDTATDNETVLYRFQGGGDGAGPRGLTYANGQLYGITAGGGSSSCGCGTVFRLPLSGGTPTTLHAFAGGSDGSEPLSTLLPVGKFLYGTTYNGGTGNCNDGYGCGTLFSIDTRTGAEKTLYSFRGGKDGAEPEFNLILLHGKLYGVTSNGGTSDCQGRFGCGVLYQFDLATHKERVIFAFRVPGISSGTAGATITLAGNTIYGTTQVNNTGFNGTIFSYTP